MTEDVKRCVDARVQFFDSYFTVPQSVKGEVDAVIADILSLGAGCDNAAEFEEQFSTTGLSDRFNSIIPKCIPKSTKMTKEQKQNSKRIMKDIIVENKSDLMKDAASDIAKKIDIEASGAFARESRERMIEEGTYADYSTARNRMKNIDRLAGFLKDRLGKK